MVGDGGGGGSDRVENLVDAKNHIPSRRDS